MIVVVHPRIYKTSMIYTDKPQAETVAGGQLTAKVEVLRDGFGYHRLSITMSDAGGLCNTLVLYYSMRKQNTVSSLGNL